MIIRCISIAYSPVLNYSALATTSTIPTKLSGLQEMADMCRSLLFGKRLKQAEAMLNTLISQQFTPVSLINVFIEHYLDTGDSAKAKSLLAVLGTNADLTSYFLFLKSHLKSDDVDGLRTVLKAAERHGVPLIAFLAFPGWSIAEKVKLKPLVMSRPSTMGLPFESLDEADDFVKLDIRQNVPFKECNVNSLPDVNVVKTANGGIELMMKALACLDNATEFNLKQDDLFKAQLRLEEASVLAAEELLANQQNSRIRSFAWQGKGAVIALKSGKVSELVQTWVAHFSDWLKKEIDRQLDRGITDNSQGQQFCAILSGLPAEKISLATVCSLVNLKGFDGELGGVKLVGLARDVGKRLRDEMLAEIVASRPFLHRGYSPDSVKLMMSKWDGRNQVERMAVRAAEELVEAGEEIWLPTWSIQKTVQLGTWLISQAIMQCLYCQSPAFVHEVVFDKRTSHSQGIIRPSKQLMQLLTTSSAIHEPTTWSEPWSLPMVVAPRPWLTFSSGGYLTRRQPFVRLKDEPMHEEVLKQADKEGLLDQVKHGLDVLGQTAWRINSRILQVQIKMWNAGLDLNTLTGFPKEILSNQAPQKPAYTPGSPREFYARLKEWQKLSRQFSECFSIQCDTNYRLQLARVYSQMDRFYLPHTVDFRGRAYTCPPHLSHLGSDPARGLLVFAEGLRLGGQGLFWLKVHLANMHGFDKASLDDRCKYTEDHVDEVLKAAEDPAGSDWWKMAEEPWQCLAACMELHQVLTQHKGPAEEYLSHLPVQQDGSCNGLQHYAALGGDPSGAEKVNLSPSSLPQDVYRSVADLVSRQIDEDCSVLSADSDEGKLARLLQGKISRKIVKTTVMTNVYGVTEYGAREQLESRLRESQVLDTDDDIMKARTYLARLVFSSLKELFVQAKKIQDWLTMAAKEIVHALPEESAVQFGYSPDLLAAHDRCQSYRRPEWRPDSAVERLPEKAKLLSRYPQTMVAWTTPLNFIVIQPYSRTKTLALATNLQQISVRIPGPADPVDPAKQSAGFPPNFIHSLDATHMFMTARACHQAGMTFASVHDCYWTHAGSVDSMSRLLREQFVELYKDGKIMEQLKREFETRYRGYKVPVKVGKSGGELWRDIHFAPVPERGPFDIASVLKSRYFFS